MHDAFAYFTTFFNNLSIYRSIQINQPGNELRNNWFHLVNISICMTEILDCVTNDLRKLRCKKYSCYTLICFKVFFFYWDISFVQRNWIYFEFKVNKKHLLFEFLSKLCFHKRLSFHLNTIFSLLYRLKWITSKIPSALSVRSPFQAICKFDEELMF